MSRALQSGRVSLECLRLLFPEPGLESSPARTAHERVQGGWRAGLVLVRPYYLTRKDLISAFVLHWYQDYNQPRMLVEGG